MLVLLLIALAGCVPGPAGQLRPLTAAEAAARDDVVVEWAQVHGPLPAGCAEDLPRMRVTTVATHAEMQSAASYYCGPSSAPDDGTNCKWGRAVGAQRPARTGGLWPFALFERPWPLVVMWADSASPRLLAHEVGHYLDTCYGLPADYHAPP